MTKLSGFIARETEKAVAFVTLPLRGEHKPLWIPKKKILERVDLDTGKHSIQLAGEGIRRLAAPVELTVDTSWIEKVGV